MSNPNFKSSILLDQTPKEVFDAINNVRSWWSENIDGRTDELGAVFKYRHEDIHRCTMKIVELTANKKIVWLVEDNYFSFTEDKTEWKGTKVIFEIARKGDKTEIRFTHEGLVPGYECFDICSNAWGSYINRSLRKLIATGKGILLLHTSRATFAEFLMTPTKVLDTRARIA
jgi:hypothetical protein